MSKETFYFSHDYNARNDDKILELRANFGAEGYGLFWMIVESMAENENGGIKATLLGGLSLGYGVAKDTVCKLITHCLETGLFYDNQGVYYSKRLLTHKEYRKSLSESGAAGAAKRWGGYKGGNSTPNAKERKGKEIKGKEIKEPLSNSASSVENDFDLKTLLNPPKFPTWRLEVKEFLADEYLIQEYVRNKKIPYAIVVGFMRDFVTGLNLKGDFKKYNALKIHFNHHYEKHHGNKILKATNGSHSNAFIDVPDNLDYDKMETW